MNKAKRMPYSALLMNVINDVFRNWLEAFLPDGSTLLENTSSPHGFTIFTSSREDFQIFSKIPSKRAVIYGDLDEDLDVNFIDYDGASLAIDCKRKSDHDSHVQNENFKSYIILIKNIVQCNLLILPFYCKAKAKLN